MIRLRTNLTVRQLMLAVALIALVLAVPLQLHRTRLRHKAEEYEQAARTARLESKVAIERAAQAEQVGQVGDATRLRAQAAEGAFRQRWYEYLAAHPWEREPEFQAPRMSANGTIQYNLSPPIPD
jgi:hypothetical protein